MLNNFKLWRHFLTQLILSDILYLRYLIGVYRRNNININEEGKVLKKLFIITLSMILVFGMTAIGYAGLDDSNAEKGLSASPAFEKDTNHENDDHFNHQNEKLRFSTKKGHIAIGVEEPGLNSDENSVVSEHHHDQAGSVIDTNN